MTLLTPEVLSILIIDALFLFFGTITFFLSARIFLQWDINAATPRQYQLEKQSFLAAAVIKYILLIKIPLFLYFIFTQDKLSNVIPGAMCAAGVVNATEYGFYLFIFKIINLYMFGAWLLMHHIDIKSPDYPYTKIKFGLFLLIFLLLAGEIALEVLMFYHINPAKIVSCCGTLFSAADTSYASSFITMPPWIILGLFYGSFCLLLLFYVFKKALLFGLANIFFIFTAIVSLIAFFSTYVYELPTHHCPFCLLQKEYYFIGYLMYSTLFIGTFSGIGASLLTLFLKKNNQKWMYTSLLFNTFYLIIVTAYPVSYYLKNGVWL